jgi:glycosyltransferase involved in cell wall biosynthesis
VNAVRDEPPGRLRVLFVAPFPPRLDATHGGAKVVGELINGTAERHSVALVHLRHRAEPPVEDELRSRLEISEDVLRPADARTSPGHYARALRWRARLLAGTPRQASELAFRAARARIRDVARRWRPDVVRIEYPVMAAFLSALDGVPAVRLLADYDALLETTRLPGSALETLEHRLDLRAWRSFRRRALANVDAAVVPTERDRAVLLALGVETDVVSIPFGSRLGVPALDAAGTDGSLLFVGNLNHPPNLDSAQFLVSTVFPRLRERHPNAVLHLVGEGTSDLSPTPGVERLGRVPDLTPLLDAAAVVLAPSRLGAGMRVKIVDALVAGKAVVATPLAVSGLALEPGRDAVVVDADDFADAVCALLSNRLRRAELGRNARAWALANLGWDPALDAHDALYRSLLSRAAGARS